MHTLLRPRRVARRDLRLEGRLPDTRSAAAHGFRPRDPQAHSHSIKLLAHFPAMGDVNETPGVLSALLAAGEKKALTGETPFAEQ